MNRKKKYIIVKDSPVSGKGVFAINNIKVNQILEVCNHILLTQEYKDLDEYLKTYVFAWPKYYRNRTASTVVLGCGSLYNDSKDPNVDWETDEENNVFIFKAIKDIKAGQELFTNYGDQYYNGKSIHLK